MAATVYGGGCGSAFAVQICNCSDLLFTGFVLWCSEPEMVATSLVTIRGTSIVYSLQRILTLAVGGIEGVSLNVSDSRLLRSSGYVNYFRADDRFIRLNLGF
ncbi:hypothetical protein L195_g048350 [Trifolium pratense]|uniref:Uncharacterized protein n=1 Tax=Trifolium pratense TaxID=57577 RepID=A0A2K3JL19_TRIPR|nr:hypothetical protein L195_g048350 [Trifolium pratense]